MPPFKKIYSMIFVNNFDKSMHYFSIAFYLVVICFFYYIKFCSVGVHEHGTVFCVLFTIVSQFFWKTL